MWPVLLFLFMRPGSSLGPDGPKLPGSSYDFNCTNEPAAERSNSSTSVVMGGAS